MNMSHCTKHFVLFILYVVIFILYETKSTTSSCHDQNGWHVCLNPEKKFHLVVLSSYISLPQSPPQLFPPGPKMPTESLPGTIKNVHYVPMLPITDIQIFLLEKDNVFDRYRFELCLILLIDSKQVKILDHLLLYIFLVNKE